VEIDQMDNIFSNEAEMNLYRITQECRNHIVKHSGAAETKVMLTRDGSQVRLVIEDNGKGFDFDPSSGPGLRGRGFGLTSISERARMLGGKEVIRGIPGEGTKVSITVPLWDRSLEDLSHEG
jgi:signal transduction histidine kinase